MKLNEHTGTNTNGVARGRRAAAPGAGGQKRQRGAKKYQNCALGAKNPPYTTVCPVRKISQLRHWQTHILYGAHLIARVLLDAMHRISKSKLEILNVCFIRKVWRFFFISLPADNNPGCQTFSSSHTKQGNHLWQFLKELLLQPYMYESLHSLAGQE